MSRVEIVDLHCHNPACALFNREQEFRWAPTCWEHPGEWVDEPECRFCYSEMHELPIDVQAVVEEAAQRFNDDWLDWTPADRVFFAAVTAYLAHLEDDGA